MEYKLMIAANLRKGIQEIKTLRLKSLYENPLWSQWTYLAMNNKGMEWNHDEIDHRFAMKSRKLFNKIRQAA